MSKYYKYKCFLYLFVFTFSVRSISVNSIFLTQRDTSLRKVNENSTDHCIEYSDCLSCLSPDNDVYGCNWSNEQCIQSSAFYENSWYTKLQQCTESVNEMKVLNCGSLFVNGNTITIEGEELYGIYGKEHIFCKWEYTKTSKKPLNVEVDKKEDCYLGIEVITKDKSTFYEITNDFSSQFINYDSINIYYYGHALYEDKPFSLEMEINKYYSFSQIALYLVIAVCITLLLFFMITLFFCCTKYIQRQKLNKGKKVQKKSFCSLTINVTEYNNQIKIFNKKCPICLEEIKENEKLAILLCYHGFHDKCLKKWILIDEEKNQYCPVCHQVMKNTTRSSEKGKLNNNIDS